MRRYERNFGRTDPLKAALTIREAFMDRPAERQEELPWKWPRMMKEVGVWEPGEGAVMYASPKWQTNPRNVIDYKHLAEGRQRLLVVPGFLEDYDTGRKLRVGGPMVELDDMPDAFAVLAEILGIQAHLYDGNEEDYQLGDYYQIDIAHAMLGAAKHPGTGETFLFVYTDKKGPLCLITGDILDVEKDGIVG